MSKKEKPMDGVYAFGSFSKPSYRASCGRLCMFDDKWCCDEGHSTPKQAAQHLAARMAAAWE